MTDKKLIRHLELPNDIKSDYLDWGFAQENMNIWSIVYDFENKTAKGSVDINSGFRNKYEKNDNSWHWSSITAYRVVSQLAVGYICEELGKTKKEIGEIMQISSKMNTRWPIILKEEVPVNISFKKYFKRNEKLFSELEFDIYHNAFNGSMRFAVDLRPKDKRKHFM